MRGEIASKYRLIKRRGNSRHVRVALVKSSQDVCDVFSYSLRSDAINAIEFQLLVSSALSFLDGFVD